MRGAGGLRCGSTRTGASQVVHGTGPGQVDRMPGRRCWTARGLHRPAIYRLLGLQRARQRPMVRHGRRGPVPHRPSTQAP